MAEYDSGLVTIECTKRAAAFGLWGVWSLFGRGLFADLVETTFDLGRRFYEMLAATDDFQPLHEPQCNIVAFRHLPHELAAAPPETMDAFQLKLRRSVIESGEFYIVPCRIDGQSALRVTIINPLTTEGDLRELLAALRRHGHSILTA
jgi:L-2,4-diaminobutyrate decarboxylase